MCRVVKAVCENPGSKYLREEWLYTCQPAMAQTISVAPIVLGFECCLECGRSLIFFFFGIFIEVPGKDALSCDLAWILGGGT